MSTGLDAPIGVRLSDQVVLKRLTYVSPAGVPTGSSVVRGDAAWTHRPVSRRSGAHASALADVGLLTAPSATMGRRCRA